MDQKPPESSGTSSASVPSITPAAPPAQEQSVDPANTPLANPSFGSDSTTPTTPGQPHDVPPRKGSAMIYAIITLVVVLIAAAAITFMHNSGAAPAVNTTVVVLPTQPPAHTETPSVMPVPSSAEAEVDTVNVTEDNNDLQKAEKDLNSL